VPSNFIWKCPICNESALKKTFDFWKSAACYAWLLREESLPHGIRRIGTISSTDALSRKRESECFFQLLRVKEVVSHFNGGLKGDHVWVMRSDRARSPKGLNSINAEWESIRSLTHWKWRTEMERDWKALL
jgi:hypothetical protein